MTNRVVIFFLAALAVPLAGWGGTVLTLQDPASPVTVGSSFWVTANISGAEDLYAYEFDLSFPADLLQFLGVENGDFLPAADLLLDSPLYDDSLASSGYIGAIANTLTGDAPGANGDGWLAGVQFQALAPGIADIEPLNLIFLNSNFDQATDFSGIGTVFTIVNSPSGAVPEPATWVLLAAAGAVLAWRRLRAA
jgi:hypothetical protein